MKQDKPLSTKNVEAWNTHYLRTKSRQMYPDENLVRILKSAQQGSALDIGCGSGRHLRLLLDIGFEPVFGIDTSPEAINISKEVAPEADCKSTSIDKNGNIDLFKGLIGHKFNVIIAWGVLHYNSPEVQSKMINQIYDNLKPGGIFTGTLRSDNDTNFKNNQDINSAPIYFYSEQQVNEILELSFNNIQIGYLERGPIGNVEERVCHWIFVCKKNL